MEEQKYRQQIIEGIVKEINSDNVIATMLKYREIVYVEFHVKYLLTLDGSLKRFFDANERIVLDKIDEVIENRMCDIKNYYNKKYDFLEKYNL